MAAQPPVEIVIDRIDVRLTAAQPPPRPADAPLLPPLSLADYLDRRSGR